MFILNEEIKEQERQAIRELYPKFPDTQVIVTKVPLTPYIDKHDLVIETMQKLHPYKGNIREIKSYLTTELIKLDASRSSTLTGIELMKTTPL